MRRALLYVGGWLTAVVVATAVGFAAISLVGDDVGAPSANVGLIATAQASSTPEPSATGDATQPPSPGATSDDKGQTDSSPPTTQSTDQGTVTGLCRSGSPRLVSWSPKNGWSVAEVDKTGTRRAVVFSDGTTYVTVALRCGARGPVFSVTSAAASPSPEPTPTETSTPTPTPSVAGDEAGN